MQCLVRVSRVPTLVAKRYSSGPANKLKPSFWSHSNFENFGKFIIEGQQHAAAANGMWKKLVMFVAFPSVAILGYFALTFHYHEMSEPRPEFVAYPHVWTRTRPYPWGDGEHSWFHNPLTNPLRTGYEMPDPNAGKEHGHH